MGFSIHRARSLGTGGRAGQENGNPTRRPESEVWVSNHHGLLAAGGPVHLLAGKVGGWAGCPQRLGFRDTHSLGFPLPIWQGEGLSQRILGAVRCEGARACDLF